jgi:hypothetical protein
MHDQYFNETISYQQQREYFDLSQKIKSMQQETSSRPVESTNSVISGPNSAKASTNCLEAVLDRTTADYSQMINSIEEVFNDSNPRINYRKRKEPDSNLS